MPHAVRSASETYKDEGNRDAREFLARLDGLAPVVNDIDTQGQVPSPVSTAWLGAVATLNAALDTFIAVSTDDEA